MFERSDRARAHSAAGVEDALDLAEGGVAAHYDFVQDLVDRLLLKDLALPKAAEKVPERLLLEQTLARHIGDSDRAEVRCAGERADGGELGEAELNLVRPVRKAVSIVSITG
jgi:hypothetical protein